MTYLFAFQIDKDFVKDDLYCWHMLSKIDISWTAWTKNDIVFLEFSLTKYNVIQRDLGARMEEPPDSHGTPESRK